MKDDEVHKLWSTHKLRSLFIYNAQGIVGKHNQNMCINRRVGRENFSWSDVEKLSTGSDRKSDQLMYDLMQLHLLRWKHKLSQIHQDTDWFNPLLVTRANDKSCYTFPIRK